MATKVEVTKILAGLVTLYPRHKLDEATYEAYYRILKDIPADLLDGAALQAGSTSTFFPSASELRSAAFTLMEVAQGVPNAWDAWAEVCKSFGPYGRARIPQWSHPLIKRAIDAIGGYIALCDSENAVADRARFVQAYEALLHRAQQDARMLPEVRMAVRRLADGMSGGNAKQLSALVSEFTRGMERR